MKEIGGYIEMEKYHFPVLHGNAIALNCGRNSLLYLLRAKNIKKIVLPRYLCDSVRGVCERESVKIRFYSMKEEFLPENIILQKDEWFYLVNYFGQLSNRQIKKFKMKYKNLIVDQAQAYFQTPLKNVDTIYTCRKFFGVPDGAFLYTDTILEKELEQDESHKRMSFLLGRYERGASEFYQEYKDNNNSFDQEPIKKMSRLTRNLLHAIDYKEIKDRRTDNYACLYDRLKEINKLNLKKIEGAFMYPLYIDNGRIIREQLIEQKIYIPILWPDVFHNCSEEELEYQMAENILPLPCDHRYNSNEMNYIVEKIIECLKNVESYKGGLGR